MCLCRMVANGRPSLTGSQAICCITGVGLRRLEAFDRQPFGSQSRLSLTMGGVREEADEQLLTTDDPDPKNEDYRPAASIAAPVAELVGAGSSVIVSAVNCISSQVCSPQCTSTVGSGLLLFAVELSYHAAV